MKELALAALSIVSSFAVVLLLVAIGWYIVWKLFLSRFKFVRELLGGMSESSSSATSSQARDSRSNLRKPRRE